MCIIEGSGACSVVEEDLKVEREDHYCKGNAEHNSRYDKGQDEVWDPLIPGVLFLHKTSHLHTNPKDNRNYAYDYCGVESQETGDLTLLFTRSPLKSARAESLPVLPRVPQLQAYELEVCFQYWLKRMAQAMIKMEKTGMIKLLSTTER